MRQIQIPNRPYGLAFGLTLYALPKEHQFETEPFTMRPCHITGVIPPFRVKIFMFEMISGKLVCISGQRLTVWQIDRRQRENKKRNRQPRHRPEPKTMSLFHAVTMRP